MTEPSETSTPPSDTGDRDTVVFEVFNPDSSVGVGCNREGEVIGLHLNDDARDNGDSWLAEEILRVAQLTHLKSRLGLRREMESNGVLPHTVDAFDLPTEATYRAAEHAAFTTPR
ncbi:hypothetical protein JK358_35695 [Nocardia sp. 2]|uniref:DUF2694 domain-containing protein n=1 Tax=Nocardia acididurans TaxID=2802282 RepID=A0ABS1MHL2_9NOCA|nr:hypothetical protein [Nocardia acididurans]MBL1079759.1 hypothetical protein [Nocardia acididurans]